MEYQMIKNILIAENAALAIFAERCSGV